MEFIDRTAIVSGATRGIGLAITKALLKQGAQVIGTYVSKEETAEALRQEAEQNQWKLQLKKFDVSDYFETEKFFTELQEEIEHLDILIANSGIRRDSALALMKEEDWERVIQVNLTGSFHMARFAIPWMMRKRYGRIVMMTSPMSHTGFAGQANYAASKAGQIGMMGSMMREVATRGITVNCVSPGFVETELIADLDEKRVKDYKAMVPMRRFAQPDEVAEAVLFLASPKAAYITGTVLDVTGGL